METPDTTPGDLRSQELANQPSLLPMSESDRERLVRLETQVLAYEKRISRLEKILLSAVGVVVLAVFVALLALVLR